MNEVIQTSSDVVWPDWRSGSRRKARENLSNSYANQWYRIDIDGKLYELRPVASAGTESAACSPSQAHYFLSAWNAHGINLEQDEHDKYNVALMTALEEAGYAYRRCVTLQKNLGWFEPSFVVKFPSDQIAREWAWRFGQLAVVKWDSQHLDVLPSNRGGVKRHTSQWQLVAIENRQCPVKKLERDSACVPYGGPWTSSSINAFVTWQEHRYLMISMLGCDVCSNGLQTVGGKIKSTIESDYKTRLGLKMASRFGGYEQ